MRIMDVRVCMNGVCASSNSFQWKTGWPLRSGELATLCHHCGSVYKQLNFCETFHSGDSGWRECSTCGKRLHCGCIASSSFLELMDTGGVNCIDCGNRNKLPSALPKEKPRAYGVSAGNVIQQHIDKIPSAVSGDDESSCQENLSLSKNVSKTFHTSGEIKHKFLSSSSHSSLERSKDFGPLQENEGPENVHKLLVQTNLSIGLSMPSKSYALPGTTSVQRGLLPTISPFKQEFKPLHLSPRLAISNVDGGIGTTSNTVPQLRVARPPVEGRVKNQLLPRYWPRITDQELQEISGDSNSTIIPLFEKVLSASDAGRIGRLVLPKACAEAYFPPISQPEGLPLRIQDVKGNKWIFQFRFWPNNNSRMYVLEGVTPCIQSMQLQAGDTVTFSRMDPEGKLLMGFRKVSNNISSPLMLADQDSHLSAVSCYAFQGEPLLTAVENLPMIHGCSSLLQSLKGSKNPSMTMSSKHIYNTLNIGSKLGENLPEQPECKANRNIGSKSKRLIIDDHDALELKVSWEEIQDMLRPPPCVNPTTVTIEDHEFEEFEEPPVFGKRSIFVICLSGEHQQWAQCDSCFKWRKLPVDFLLPAKWTCLDNPKGSRRFSCSAPDELSSWDVENLLRMNKEFKKQRIEASLKSQKAHASEEVEGLGNVAAGDCDTSESASVAATTTKHPRHRPGCSCIVCIQPPSGKGKHKPTCVCNVCLTVKRRFKTLMMRKKKRQSDREAEFAHRIHLATTAKEEAEVDSIPYQEALRAGSGRSESDLIFRCQDEDQSQDYVEIVKGVGLDLNMFPGGENIVASRVSMMTLLHEASLPLDTYLKQNGLTSLVDSDHQVSSHLQQVPEVTTIQKQEDHDLSNVRGHENEDSEHECSARDHREDYTS